MSYAQSYYQGRQALTAGLQIWADSRMDVGLRSNIDLTAYYYKLLLKWLPEQDTNLRISVLGSYYPMY